MTDALVLTGGGGWFGRAFLADLATRPTGEVRVLVERPGDVPGVLDLLPSARVYVGDVRSDADVGELFAGLVSHRLIHAAAVIHPARVADFTSVNASGTERVVRTAVAAGLARMVHVSSNSPIGTNVSPEEVFRDHEPYQPYLGYGQSKMLAELAVRRRLQAAGIPGVVVRPPWFYGPYQPERQARFLRTVRLGRFPMIGDGSNRRSMVYVDHLVQGVRLALAASTDGVHTYWIADERPYAMTEIVAAVQEAARLTGLEVVDRVRRLPSLAGTVAEHIDAALQRRGRYQQEIHVAGELNKSIACSIAGATQDLGYHPHVSLVEGMRRSYAYGLDHGQEV